MTPMMREDMERELEHESRDWDDWKPLNRRKAGPAPVNFFERLIMACVVLIVAIEAIYHLAR